MRKLTRLNTIYWSLPAMFLAQNYTISDAIAYFSRRYYENDKIIRTYFEPQTE